MKKIFLLFVLILFGCSCGNSVRYTEPRISRMLIDVRDATVTLVKGEDGSSMDSYCSGVFITKFNVLTAAHCINNSKNEFELDSYPEIIKVAVFSFLEQNGEVKRSIEFRVNRYDEKKDLAILDAINPEEMLSIPHTVLRLSERDTFYPGERVFVSGTPIGMWWTIADGIISRDRVRIPVLRNRKDVEFIQASANSYFGNSGGPLVDVNGEIIGIADIIVSRQNYLSLFVRVNEVREFLFEN